MRLPTPSSRREFVRRSGLAIGAAGAVLSANEPAIGQPAAARGPDAVLARFAEGNRRFVNGELEHPGRRPEDFAPLAEGQAPVAAIVGCADSRVSPELVFDQGVGDLFVVRVAGNLVSGAGPALKGSIEFAVAELGVRLIVVLGHERMRRRQGRRPAHRRQRHPARGDSRSRGAHQAGRRRRSGESRATSSRTPSRPTSSSGVERLKGLDPILSGFVKTGELKVVGGVYELRTGQVEWLD